MKKVEIEDLVKSFENFRYRQDLANVFQDWLELVAIEFSNPVDIKNFHRRNERYKEIMKNYNQEEFQEFCNILNLLIALMEQEPDDYLGRLYMELELYNTFRGQFFTPLNLAALLSAIEFADVVELLDKQGYATVNDPACGSGVTIIGLYKLFQLKKLNPQQVMKVVVQDIDKKSVHMAYIQLSLLGLNATVIQCDTLTMETWDVWRSPGYFFGWGSSLVKPASEVETNTEKEDKEPLGGEQLSFF